MNLQQSAGERADQLAADRSAIEKFAVGQSVPRTEDPMLPRGMGHYTDDDSLPGQAYTVMIRSQNAHGVIYDSDGQLLTGSFMDYAMPRAADVPSFVLADHPAPAKTNPLGVKGCGEAGCAGALTSVMNAVMDALADQGIRHLDMPLTPASIWQALHDARTQSNTMRSKPNRPQ